LTEHILGISRAPIKRIYDIEKVFTNSGRPILTNSGRPIRFKSGFDHTGITCRSIVSFIQRYELNRIMELHLAQGLKIEYEDFMPILEALDEVAARAAYLCKDGLAHENKLNTDLRLAGLFPDMLPFSDSVLSYAAHSRGMVIGPIGQGAIDDAKYYYTYVLPRFRIDLLVPSTCMMSNKLLVEIMRRVKACNKHDKLVGDIGLESIDPALCSMSDMFTYSVSDITKGDTVAIHDELSQRTKHQLSEHNVVIGHNPDGRVVTRNLEYYENYSSSMTSCPLSTSILEAVRRKRSGCELDKTDIELLAANDDYASNAIKDQVDRGSDFKKISIGCRGSDYMKTLFSKVSESVKVSPVKTSVVVMK